MPLDHITGLGKYEEPKDYALISINELGNLQLVNGFTLTEISERLKKDNLKQIAIRKEGIIRW